MHGVVRVYEYELIFGLVYPEVRLQPCGLSVGVCVLQLEGKRCILF